MHLIKLQYSIHYTHILTFVETYKDVIAPFFEAEGLKYGFNNFGTFDEGIRLIYEKSGFAIVAQKDSCVLVYEGSDDELKTSSAAPISMFIDVVNAIKTLKGFGRFVFHHSQTHFFFPYDGDVMKDGLTKTFNGLPFADISDYAAVFELKDQKSGVDIGFQIGNFRINDIARLDLSPFKADRTRELLGKEGYIFDIKMKEASSTVSYSKFRGLFDGNLDYANKLARWMK